MNNKNYIQLVILSLVVLSGCTPTRVNNTVKLSDFDGWHHPAADSSNVTLTDLKTWWQGFKDPLLNDLITQALNANHDVKIAKARVREATTSITIAKSALYPSLDFSLFGGREKRLTKLSVLADKALN